MTTALYRRYRPESFADVIGQEHVTEPLMQALRTGRVGHAYLFSGPRGCGKTTSARILARCLNCAQGPTPTPCGACESCLALARGGPGSVDVIEIDAASHGGVDDARDLRERASYGPAQSRFKIYIIDEAHMVTPQGFNALLKIVEEPPEHVKFVFATTEPEKVIGTIRSRTHHYPFRLVPPAKLVAYLERLLEREGVLVEPGVLSFVSRAGGGSVRDSLSVLDQLIAGSGPDGLTYDEAVSLLGFTDAELLDATIDALAAGDGAGMFRQIDRVIESGHDPRRFVEDLLERLRDLIIVAAVRDGAGQVLRGVAEDQLERMRVQQAAFGPGALSRAADIVNTGLTEMTGATSPRLQLELICARILLPGVSGEQGYAARLDRLERRLEVGGLPTPSSAQGEPPVPPVVEHAASPAASSERPASSVPSAPASAGSSERPASSVPSAAPPSAPAVGGLDTDAIRRAWPDVLGRVFQMRRITWTFVSQNAHVLGYDGRTLTLGIGTEGLTNTFRSGNHAEVVRQALIDELGLDAVVEGVHASDPASPQAGSMRSAPAFTDSEGPGRAERPPAREASLTRSAEQPGREPSGPAARASGPRGSGPRASRPRADPPAGAGLSPAPPRSSIEDNAGWGSGTAAPPDWAVSPTSAGDGPQQNGDGRVHDVPETEGPAVADSRDAPTRRSGRAGADAVRASLDAARRTGMPSVPGREEGPRRPVPEASTMDDSAVSDDDEDIEVSTDVGRAVIEKVLGGRVLQELDE